MEVTFGELCHHCGHAELANSTISSFLTHAHNLANEMNRAAVKGILHYTDEASTEKLLKATVVSARTIAPGDTFFLGVAAGFGIELSTCGAHAVVAYLVRDIVEVRSRLVLLWFNLVWPLASATVAMMLLGYVRTSVVGVSSEDRKDKRMTEDEQECRFAEGAIIGICILWTVIDLVVGTYVWTMCSSMLLALTIAWSRLMRSTFANHPEALLDIPDTAIIV